jgi:hypothetical protein
MSKSTEPRLVGLLNADLDILARCNVWSFFPRPLLAFSDSKLLFQGQESVETEKWTTTLETANNTLIKLIEKLDALRHEDYAQIPLLLSFIETANHVCPSPLSPSDDSFNFLDSIVLRFPWRKKKAKMLVSNSCSQDSHSNRLLLVCFFFFIEFSGSSPQTSFSPLLRSGLSYLVRTLLCRVCWYQSLQSFRWGIWIGTLSVTVFSFFFLLSFFSR